MKKHINIPVFIPHFGCPNACVFCNQRKITGVPCYERDKVKGEIEAALSTVSLDSAYVEIAFFGGSFTAIPREEMLGLLEISDEFIKSGRVSGVRLSTRPDAIDDEILDILQSHGVRVIELGLQSFSNEVLAASKRGHNAKQSEAACKKIKERGFTLIGQMMSGLPHSTLEDEIYTAKRIADLGCDGARLYPTVVFPETELHRMLSAGEYEKMTTEEAVRRGAEILAVFAKRGVPLIRIGLCSNETLECSDFEGNYHPSVGEMIINRYYLKAMEALLENKASNGKTAVFCVAKGKISQAVGQKRSNAEALKSKFGLKAVKVKENESISGYGLLCDIE